jgi:hypothetical protein
LYLQLLEVLRSYSSLVNQQERTAMATRNRVTATVRTNIIDLDTAERIAADGRTVSASSPRTRGRSLLMLGEQAGDQEQQNDGKGVSGMADPVEPGSIRTWYHEQGAGEPLVLLLVRGQARDRSRALRLLERALATADTMGIRTLQATQAAQDGGPMPAEPTGAVAETARTLFRREGEYWTVAYDGAVVRLHDAKGLRHLARLLAHPGREFHAVDLEAADRPAATAAPAGAPGRAQGGELAVRADLGDAGELLDATAKAAYRARLVELRAELEEAEGCNDPARAAKARAELDFLVGELARAVGLGGRDRRASAHAERARLNATRAIRAAMANVARANPALGRHLAATIRTGRYCVYTPDPRALIAWER